MKKFIVFALLTTSFASLASEYCLAVRNYGAHSINTWFDIYCDNEKVETTETYFGMHLSKSKKQKTNLKLKNEVESLMKARNYVKVSQFSKSDNIHWYYLFKKANSVNLGEKHCLVKDILTREKMNINCNNGATMTPNTYSMQETKKLLGNSGYKLAEKIGEYKAFVDKEAIFVFESK